MFFLWVNIIRIKKINSIFESTTSVDDKNSVEFIKVSFMKFTTKTVKVANIEDTEEYLNISDITNQVNANKKNNCKDKAASIPTKVATPLPPLNFNQIGKRCPKKANMHDNSINSGKYFAEIKTGI